MSELESAGLFFLVSLWLACVLMCAALASCLCAAILDRVRAEPKNGDIWRPHERPTLGMIVFLVVITAVLGTTLYHGAIDIWDYLRAFF